MENIKPNDGDTSCHNEPYAILRLPLKPIPTLSLPDEAPSMESSKHASLSTVFDAESTQWNQRHRKEHCGSKHQRSSRKRPRELLPALESKGLSSTSLYSISPNSSRFYPPTEALMVISTKDLGLVGR